MAGPEYIGDYEYSYGRSSGTSMASPHVAGIAALMLQANPELSPADIKTKLMNTAVPMTNDYNVFEVGAGRVNPQAAIDTTMMFQTTMDGLHVEDSLLTLIPDRTGAISFGPVSTANGTFVSIRAYVLQIRVMKQNRLMCKRVSKQLTEHYQLVQVV